MEERTDRYLRETVLVIHGTFDAPVEGLTKWWQPGGSFCTQLDADLAALGQLDIRCWAHCEDGHFTPFHWDGLNNWRSRQDAANRLHDHLKELLQAGWRCHLVAHSHGGNIALRARDLDIATYLKSRLNNPATWGATLDGYRSEDLWYNQKGYGEIVCFGTPFIEMAQFEFNWITPRGRENLKAIPFDILMSVLLFAVAVAVWFCRQSGDTMFFWFSAVFAVIFGLYAIFGIGQSLMLGLGALILPSQRRTIEQVKAEQRKQAAAATKLTYWTHLLVQNSVHDEARILLKTFVPKQFALRTSPVRRALRMIGGRLRSGAYDWYEATMCMVRPNSARWHRLTGGDNARAERLQRLATLPVFLLLLIAVAFLLFAGFSWLAGTWRLDVLAFIASPVAIYLLVTPGGRSDLMDMLADLAAPVRQLAAAFIMQFIAIPIGYDTARRAALGLEDFPYDPSMAVDTVPFWHSRDFFIYEEIDEKILGAALDRRRMWLDALLARVPSVATDTAMIGELFRDIVGDPSLVHSAYYLAPSNCARIARFLMFRR